VVEVVAGEEAKPQQSVPSLTYGLFQSDISSFP